MQQKFNRLCFEDKSFLKKVVCVGEIDLRTSFLYCFVCSYGDGESPTQTAATAEQPSDTVEEMQHAGMEWFTVCVGSLECCTSVCLGVRENIHSCPL